ncbi:MAG TPA: T9SS type A sorting domain-containing protein, partial [Puia sp.]|nr:T9SS type A sorting domain-containing protein [Puia sp.]
GIQFCGGNATATAIQAATKTVQAGATGLNAGYLILRQFTQLGSAPVNLVLSNTATYLQFGPSSAIGGNLTSSSPGLFFNGCTFSGTVNSTKTGSTNDASTGNNIFNGASTFTDLGSGYLMFGNGNADQFNAASTFNNTGSSNIYVAWNSSNNIFGGVATFNNTPTANTVIEVSWNSAGTVFNNNIVVTSTNGQGVQFCGAAAATATLAAANTISVGAGGFSSGILLLQRFTQVGATAQSLTLTGTGNLTFGPSSAFGGNMTSVSPTLFFNGCDFGGTVTSIKNGPSNDGSIGNNTFNGAFTITNTGSGYLLMGNGNPDIWQSTATFNNLSTGQHMYLAYNSSGNIFNGDVVFNNQPSSTTLWIYPNFSGINTQFNGNISVVNVNGGGISFGAGTGTSTLASGKSISVGAGGFNFGGLIFRNFTQTGLGSAQNITSTGTSYIQFGPSASFDGPVTSLSPGLFFDGTVFNGIVNSTKTGTTNDQSQGSNIFNGSSTFTNNGTGFLLMTNNTADAYNGDVSFVKNSTGLIYPNYNNNSTYSGNLNVSASTTITFGAGTGTATCNGIGLQNINATAATPTPVFTRLILNNTGSGVTLNTSSINVSSNLTLTSGLLNTSTTYILTMLNGSSTAAGTALSTSYVNGPMKYQKSTAGISTLNFPIGKSPDCRPVVLTINHTNGTQYNYQAQLFNANANALGYSYPPTVDEVSHRHYYTIGRTDAAGTNQPTAALSGNQTIQIFFGNNDVVINGGTLTIVKNTFLAPTSWIDIGGTGGPIYAGGANLLGSLSSTSSPSAFNSFSTFALADQVGGLNQLPTQVINFNAQLVNKTVDLSWTTESETNNAYFTIEKSIDGVSFGFMQKIPSQALNGNSTIALNYVAYDANPHNGINYYRLKQTDISGNTRYWNIVWVNNNQKQSVSVYPNPTSGTIAVSGLDINENNLKVEWYDISGRLITQENVPVQNGVAKLYAEFNNGVYLLRFISPDGTINQFKVIFRK